MIGTLKAIIAIGACVVPTICFMLRNNIVDGPDWFDDVWTYRLSLIGLMVISLLGSFI